MKRILLISIIVLCSTSFFEANGQDLKRFVSKRTQTAEKATEDRVEKEADKAVKSEVNKALDKLFGKEEETTETTQPASTESSGSGSSGARTSGPGMNALMGAMGLSTGTANVKPIYEFDGFVEMTITSIKDDAEDENSLYTTYLDSKTLDYGMVFTDAGQDGTSTIIFDMENSLMLTLGESEGEKTGFAISYTPVEELEPDEEEVEEIEEEYDYYKEYKTGKTKKILGYKCDEYRMEEEHEIVTMWITNELNKDVKKSYLQNTTFAGMFMHAYYTSGFVMEYITEDLTDNEKVIMTVTAIDMNKRNTIGTNGYTIINMGTMTDEEPTDSGAESE